MSRTVMLWFIQKQKESHTRHVTGELSEMVNKMV